MVNSIYIYIYLSETRCIILQVYLFYHSKRQVYL